MAIHHVRFFANARVCLTILMALNILGCSSFLAKNQKGWGTPYAGTESAYEGKGSAIYISGMFPPAALVILPLWAADLIGSVAVDTLMLPLDLIIDVASEDVSDSTTEAVTNSDVRSVKQFLENGEDPDK